MVEIEYFGGNSIKISSSDQTIIANPDRSFLNLKPVASKNIIQVASEPRLAINDLDSLLCIEGPGEYEISKFSIKGFAMNRHTDFNNEKSATNYAIDVDDVTILLIGNVEDNFTEDHLEDLGVADILIIPIGGGGYTLDAKMAAKIVRQIEPKVVIPVHYAQPGLSYDVPQDDIELFVNELGAPLNEFDKYKIKKVTDLEGPLQIIKLKAKI